MPINGQTATKFFEIIDGAIEKAGGGKYRAFVLVTELQAVGFKIEALSPDEIAARAEETQEAA